MKINKTPMLTHRSKNNVQLITIGVFVIAFVIGRNSKQASVTRASSRVILNKHNLNTGSQYFIAFSFPITRYYTNVF